MTEVTRPDPLREAALQAVEERQLRYREILHGGPLRHMRETLPKNLVRGGLFMAGSLLVSRGFDLSGFDASFLWKFPVATAAMALILGGLDYAFTPMASRLDLDDQADDLIQGWRRLGGPWWPAWVLALGLVVGTVTVLTDLWAEGTPFDPARFGLLTVGGTAFAAALRFQWVHTHPLRGVEEDRDRLSPGEP